MRRACFFILLFFGMALAAFGQASSSDSQTLQALLTEVRELRKVLLVSIAKMQSAQILLARLQIQEVAVTRASQHLDDARSRLAEVQLALKMKRLKSSIGKTRRRTPTRPRRRSKKRSNAPGLIWNPRQTLSSSVRR